jgi:hypothetical protein
MSNQFGDVSLFGIVGLLFHAELYSLLYVIEYLDDLAAVLED